MSSDDAKTHQAAAGDWTRRELKGLPAGLDALWLRRDDNGERRYAVQLDQSHANAHGVIHGGVLMTFMDHALSMLIWEATGRGLCSTVHLDSHFLKAVRPPAFVELDAEILKQGKSLVFVRGILRVDGTGVMESTGIWSVAPAPQPAQ